MGTGFCVYTDPTLLMWQGDARDLSFLPDESVHCCVTSPPYWGLRDYGLGSDALGLEETPELYVKHLVEIFREVWRVLRTDGQLWLNLGDSYAANRSYQVTDTKHIDVGNNMSSSVPAGLKPKDLVGIPWRVAFALQNAGWYLRMDNIWNKTNPMPESVTDRPTKAHEYMFLLTKSGTTKFWTHSRKRGTRSRPDADYVWKHKQTGLVVDYQPVSGRILKRFWTKVNLWKGHDYFYDTDAVREEAQPPHGKGYRKDAHEAYKGNVPTNIAGAGVHPNGRNMRSVWTIATQPYKEAHFAVFPQALVEPCIMAGTSEKGVCKECGAPYARTVHYKANYTKREPAHAPNSAPTKVDSSGWDWPERKTTGWQPTCQCNAGPPIPATILDIFAGAGTTALVSRKLGRRAVYVDASLPYCGLALDRLMKDTVERS